VTLAFARCLAIGSAAAGRDGPAATAPIEPARTLTLSLPQDASDVVLFAFPDRLANERLINLPYIPVRVRETQGLAVNLAEVVPSNTVWIGQADSWGPFQSWMVTWTEGGTAYSISSDRRGLSELLRVAGSLR
jgi:hypothetical protein